MHRTNIVSGLMRTTSFESQPLRWREAFGGGGNTEYTQNEGTSHDVVENKPRAKMPMGHPRMLLKIRYLTACPIISLKINGFTTGALDAVRPLPANGAKAQGVRRCQARDGKRAAEEKGRTEKTNPNELT